MHAAALGTTTHKGGQSEGRPAPLAESLQSAPGERLCLEAAAMGLGNKLHQISSFCKRPCTSSVATAAISHRSPPLNGACSRACLTFMSREYTGSAAGKMIQVKNPQGSELFLSGSSRNCSGKGEKLL